MNPISKLFSTISQWAFNIFSILSFKQLACQMLFLGHLVFLLSTVETTFMSSVVKNILTTYQKIWTGLHDPIQVRFYLFSQWKTSCDFPEKKKKEKEMDHRSPMLGGIRAREIAAEELSFVEVSGSREVCVSATDFF